MSRRKLSKPERQRIYAKTNGHCAYCGREIVFYFEGNPPEGEEDT